MPRPPATDAILLDGVRKSFPGSPRPALDGVDLDVARGTFLTVVGPSGCGKSTLLRVVAGLLRPDAGTVTVFGEAPEAASAAKHLGWVPQSPALLPWRSVLDNTRLPFQVNRRAEASAPRDPRQVLERLGLGDVMHQLPATLSGGMRQRVAVARAFAFGPALLLMDEPFAALDELTRDAVGHQLLDLWQSERRTVLFVTHSVAEAVTLSDRVAVMGAGRITGTVEVTLPRPRPEGVIDSEEFHRLAQEVRSRLRRAHHALSG